MKMGMRKPSIKKSISARTTGKLKRKVKKAVIPGYGKKGTGWIKDPKKAAYNNIYNKTTVGAKDIARSKSNKSNSINTEPVQYSKKTYRIAYKIGYVLCAIILVLALLLCLASIGLGVSFLVLDFILYLCFKNYKNKANSEDTE